MMSTLTSVITRIQTLVDCFDIFSTQSNSVFSWEWINQWASEKVVEGARRILWYKRDVLQSWVLGVNFLQRNVGGSF
jgi:hypothetical protein